MARPHIRPRLWLALLLLAVLACVFAMAGRWQLGRAAQRDAIAQAMTQAAALPELELQADTPGSDLSLWRKARAQGKWRSDDTVLLENRNYQARPGYWVVTPLQLPDGRAIAVLRGWLPRDNAASQPGQAANDLEHRLASATSGAAPNAPIHGELVPRIPRAFELWSWAGGAPQLPDRLPADDASLPVVQNLDLRDYAHATGLDFLPVVLAQLSDGSDDLVRDWPHPASGADTNRGYALQWFSFCAIATAAWLAVAWRVVRQFRQASS